MPVLTLPKAYVKFSVESDASDGHLGCVLLQEQEDKHLKPIGYWPTFLSSAERSYHTKKRVYLAVVWSVLVLYPNLEGTHIVDCTDHPALRCILDLEEGTVRLAR